MGGMQVQGFGRGWKVATLALVAVSLRAAAPPTPEDVEHALRSLSTLHLLRGLQLEERQLATLTDLSEAAQSLRRGWSSSERERRSNLVEALGTYQEALLEGKAGDGLADPLALAAYRAAGAERARSNDWLLRMGALEGSLRKVLNQEQIRLVERFTRCVVSPANLSDPERIGSAGKATEGLAELRRVRSVDRLEWARQEPGWVEDWLVGVESETGPLAPERRSELETRAHQTLERVRRLDSFGFLLQGPELARFFDLESQEQEYLRGLAEARRRLEGGPGPLSEWLLSAEAGAIYPRLEALRQRGVVLPPPPDLSALSCTPGGHCATARIARLKATP